MTLTAQAGTTLRGMVSRIIYNSEDFYILSCKGDPAGRFTAKGQALSMREGGSFDFTGEWHDDPRYGRQFNFSTAREIVPDSVDGIRRYLAGKLIKGVGEGTAKKITDRFGRDTINVLDNCPERLTEIDGIGKKKMETIRDSWREHRQVNEMMSRLNAMGITVSQGLRIYAKYKKDSEKKVLSNPYCLTEVDGFGFRTADGIARGLGIGHDDPRRMRAGLEFTLERMAQLEGHCCLSKEELFSAAAQKVLETKDMAGLEKALGWMLANRKAAEENGYIYLPRLLKAEKNTALRIASICASAVKPRISASDAEAACRTAGIDLAEAQIKAVAGAARGGAMLITGGPGTGKTTVTRTIVRMYEKAGYSVLLAAPTGKAAKRLSESNGGKPAKTIHRLLGAKPGGIFEHDFSNPLEGGLLIVDECSMIDIPLMAKLVDAVPDGMPVIFVGDPDQLPSVGPGNVLKDMIKSKTVPEYRLERVYRQGKDSGIAANSAYINKGEALDMEVMPSYIRSSEDIGRYIAESREEALFCECTDPLAVSQAVRHAVAIMTGEKGIPVDEVQVLCPQKKGYSGTMNLCAAIQNDRIPLQPGAPAYPSFRTGDKVMQIQNNYDKGVFNGDSGRVAGIDRENRELTVVFDGRAVTYSFAELTQLMLAYAITIHKSQGSEYKAVIIPVLRADWHMLQRNLLYTAVSRARERVVIIGDGTAVEKAIRTNTARKRNTMLAERLRENLIRYSA